MEDSSLAAHPAPSLAAALLTRAGRFFGRLRTCGVRGSSGCNSTEGLGRQRNGSSVWVQTEFVRPPRGMGPDHASGVSKGALQLAGFSRRALS